MTRAARALHELLRRRILVLDGATATMLQARGYTDGYSTLSVSAPDVVRDLHEAYLEAGADIVKTNTFTDTDGAVSSAATRLARRAADEWTRRTPRRPRFVAGVIGPTTEPRLQTRALAEGGADLILLETIVDAAAGARAAAAVRRELRVLRLDLPLMVSATVSMSGRLAAGETPADFYRAVRSHDPFSVGLNCAFGPDVIGPALADLAMAAECPVSCHPNAGLPDAGGRYSQTPSAMAARLRAFAQAGLVDVVGGCCGTTPDHIRAIADAVSGVPPRTRP